MNINSLTASWKSFLEGQNTTTADFDLSNNLSKRVVNVFQGVENSHRLAPTKNIDYPCIYVEAVRASHDFEEMGNSSRRQKDIFIDLIAITHYGLGTGNIMTGRINSDRESMELSANIEEILKQNITMSSTIDWVLVTDATYDSTISDKAYNSIAKIRVLGRKRE